MSSFLVEAYVSADRSIGEVEAAARRAAGEASAAGAGVRYVRSILVRADETCFHLFEADSVDAVLRAAELAGLESARVVESQVTPEG